MEEEIEVETIEERRARRQQERFERQIALEMSIEDNFKAMKINYLSSNGASYQDLLMYETIKQMTEIKLELKQLNETLKK